MSKKTFWTTTTLNKSQICFLDEISRKAKFTGGKKLSRATIIRILIKVAEKLDMDVSEVRSEQELRERFLTAFGRHK